MTRDIDAVRNDLAVGYILTVGMEIHIELKTHTKMFCGCKNDPFRSEPNTNICPICYGLPGTLPLLNKQAVKMVVRLGQALKGKIAEETFWARKNYFYPDLPKGYQISQSTEPLVTDGELIIDGQTYRIARVHLEEDAAKLLHPTGGVSGVDFNRAGVPLIEIITEPDFHSSATTKRFCQELQAVLRHLDLSDADMEKGQMRCEVNISVANEAEPLGQKVEVKNINSFRAVERTIESEYRRQVEALGGGQAIIQETRTWDEKIQGTKTMRVKETSADYRYFPDPDIPRLKIDDGGLEDGKVGSGLPEEQRVKLVELGLSADQAKVLVRKRLFTKLEALAQEHPEAVVESSKIALELPELLELEHADLLALLEMRKAKGWTKEALTKAVAELRAGKALADLVGGEGEPDLLSIASMIIAENPQAANEYRDGKEPALNFLVGQLLSKTQGRANIRQARSALLKELR